MPGSVIIDLVGTELSQEEVELINHPLVGGIILFARNYESIEQITLLCEALRTASASPLLIMVDQEGGRVQRFKEGFLKLPSMEKIGNIYSKSTSKALEAAFHDGWLMASELLAVGVDMSLAPVLDLNKQLNTVIGDRAFHADPAIVIQLAESFIKGMHSAGMAATGKHFPGHGGVSVDSHLALPIDTRSLSDIFQEDLQPFLQIHPQLQAIMPAHILFPEVDDQPVGFSKKWLKTILRDQLNFSGVIMSDDLNMAGADAGGDYAARASAAFTAGCDVALICNNRKGAIEILDNLPQIHFLTAEKFDSLQGKFSLSLTDLHASTAWKNHLDGYRNAYEYSG